MTQADRDRLVTLKKAKKELITQAEASQELQVSVRQVQRMLKNLDERGDRAVVHGLRGRESNRKIDPKVRDKAARILSAEVYKGFGPTLAAEHLAQKHGITVSRETLRKWMQATGLWKGRGRRIERPHLWRERRSRCRRAGAVGHQRSRLAGGPRHRAAVSDFDDRRRDKPVVREVRR